MNQQMKQLVISLFAIVLFLIPANSFANTTYLIEGKPQSLPSQQFDYLPNVDLSIVTVASNDAAITSDLTAYQDGERAIFQSFQLPHYNEKWHIHQFNYTKAWAYEPIRPIKIAIIDTGASAQQLADSRFQNGKNFINPGQAPIDDNGHGTALASVILDVIGPYPVEIIPIKAADRTGSFTISNIVKAIDYAIEQQVDMIDLSFGAKSPHEAEQRAIDKAIEAGIAVFSASGNTGRQEYYYPAAYPNVISIGAITNELIRAPFSTYNDALDFVAPGSNLYVLRHDQPNAYTTIDGTSFATAYFTGQYALLKANSLNLATAALPTLATDLGPVSYDKEYGHGMLEADQALEKIRGKAWQLITTTERQKTWTIRVSNSLLSNQVMAEHIKIYDAALIEQPTRIIVAADQVIKVTPSIELSPGEYWLVIASSLQAKNGQQLKQPAAMKFVVK